MPNQPIFSILHATAQRLPYTWIDVWRAWSKAAVNPQDHEYVVSVHESDLEKLKVGLASIPVEEAGIPITVITNNLRPNCAVDNWNSAAKASTGKVLILGADDFYPVDKWDAELLSVIEDPFEREFIVHIGTDSPRDESLIVHPIMSRELYDRWGYFYYPGYESMYSDDDLTAHAKADPEVTIINARHIVFDHRHPILGKGSVDDGYRIMNRPEAYSIGQALFEARKANGFKDVESVTVPLPVPQALRKTLAILLPGEQFSATWVRYYTDLLYVLGQRYNLVPLFAQASNVYAVRMCLVDAVMRADKEHPIDYCLWIDDDNLITPDQVQLLIDDLETLPEADSISGWCYIVHDVFNTSLARVSCGLWHTDGSCIDLPRAFMESTDPKDYYLAEIDWTGFPVVLMRKELLVKAGPNPFAPIPSPHTPYGFSGEDTAFCKVAKERSGARFFVDRRVKVPHLKLRSAEPNDLMIALDKERTAVKLTA